MLVNLYTVRVVLETLGTEDYGIYNVVGGITFLFSFLNRAMTSATQRFLNYALGQNNIEQARDVYSISLVVYYFIALFVIILAETLGLWFLRTQIDAISGPLRMSVQATGNIKKYQLIVSSFVFANLPLSFLFLRFGYSPVWVLIIKVTLNVLTLICLIQLF
jgi:Na+-driven multidrug efflux pump